MKSVNQVQLTELVDGHYSHLVADIVLSIGRTGGHFTWHHALGGREEGASSDTTVGNHAVT